MSQTCDTCDLEFDRSMNLCEKCKCGRYCSRGCQALAWPEHKLVCSQAKDCSISVYKGEFEDRDVQEKLLDLDQRLLFVETKIIPSLPTMKLGDNEPQQLLEWVSRPFCKLPNDSELPYSIVVIIDDDVQVWPFDEFSIDVGYSSSIQFDNVSLQLYRENVDEVELMAFRVIEKM